MRIACAVAALVVSAAGASAGIAQLNPAFPIVVNNVPGQARFRADQNNWDHALIQGTNPVNARTSNVIGAVAPDPLTAGKTYQFTFENVAGLGLRTTLRELVSGTTYVQSWGDASLGGSNAATINGFGPFDAYYNVIHPYAVVTNRSTTQVSSVTWSGLSFSSPALTNVGTLTDSALAPALGNTAFNSFDNWIYTDGDLRTIDWTVTAKVTLATNAISPNPSESLKFEYGLKNAVPTPGAAALLGVAGVAAGRRRRMR